MFFREIDQLVDLVTDRHDAVVATEHVGKGRRFLFRVHGTGRVAWRRIHHQAGFWRDGGLQFFRPNLVVVFNARGNHHGSAACHLHDFFVAHPIRCRQNHFVARIHQREDHVGKALLGSRADDDLVDGVGQPVVALELLDNRLPNARRARHWGVMGFVVVDGVNARLFHGVGRVEIGFSEGQRNDVQALVFQFARFARHRNGRRFAEALEKGRGGRFHDGEKIARDAPAIAGAQKYVLRPTHVAGNGEKHTSRFPRCCPQPEHGQQPVDGQKRKPKAETKGLSQHRFQQPPDRRREHAHPRQGL